MGFWGDKEILVKLSVSIKTDYKGGKNRIAYRALDNWTLMYSVPQ